MLCKDAALSVYVYGVQRDEKWRLSSSAMWQLVVLQNITDVLEESDSYIFSVYQVMQLDVPEHSGLSTHLFENFKSHEMKVHRLGDLGSGRTKAVVHF
jgi:hypothetical protein